MSLIAPISRRAVLGVALGAMIGRPAPSLAASVEPILNNPSPLIADLNVIWAGKQPDPLWLAVSKALSAQAHSILVDEVQKAGLAVHVLRRPMALIENPFAHSPLHVRTGMELKVGPDAKRTAGSVSLRFERLGFETVQFAQPATTFLASSDGLVSRSSDAVRLQFAALVGVLSDHKA